MDHWKGKHRDDLVAYFGEPEREEALPDGGVRILYREYYQRQVCDYVLTTDEQGIIRTWEYGCD